MSSDEYNGSHGQKDDIMQLHRLFDEVESMLASSRRDRDGSQHAKAYRLINDDYLQCFLDGAIASLDAYKELVKIDALVDKRLLMEFESAHLNEIETGVCEHIKVFDEIADRYTRELPNISLPENAMNGTCSPMVSVIVPVFGVQLYICDCIDSLLAQTFRDFEIICVDDGSKDASSLALSHYANMDGRIRWIRTQNGGQSVARNIGMELARGKYLLFMDSDDKLCPEALTELVDLAEGNSLDHILFRAEAFPHNAEIAKTMARQIDAFRQFYDIPVRKEFSIPQPGAQLMVALQESAHFVMSTPLHFMRLSMLRKHNIRFKPGIIHEDCIFSVDAMIAAERAVSINKRYYLRRVRCNSIMTAPCQMLQHMVGWICTLATHMETMLLKSSDPVKVRALELFLVSISHQIGRVQLSKDDEEKLLPECLKHVSPVMAPVVRAVIIPLIEESHRKNRRKSEASCAGVFVPWPVRKFLGGVKCLHENGFCYTVKHAFGKMLRYVGFNVKW